MCSTCLLPLQIGPPDGALSSFLRSGLLDGGVRSRSLVNLQKRGFSSTPPGVHWAFLGRMDSQLKEGDRILEMGTTVMKKWGWDSYPSVCVWRLSTVWLTAWAPEVVIMREGPCPHITKRDRMLHCTVAIPHKVTQQVTKVLGTIDNIRVQQEGSGGVLREQVPYKGIQV